jgi:cation transport ATPase
MADQNNENSGNGTGQVADQDTSAQQNTVPQKEPKNQSNVKLYIEIVIILIGIILIAVASVQVKSIGHVKWNGFSEIAFPLSIIFIVSPAILYFKKLRAMKPAIAVIIIMLVGILLMYILLVPYKMFTVHFGLLGDVIVEYLIGVFLLIFMVSHMTKVHLMKNNKSGN